MRSWRLILFALLVFLAGCQPITPQAEGGEAAPPTPVESPSSATSVAGEAENTPTPALPNAGDPLANTQWQLISFGVDDAELPQTGGTAVTLMFSDDGQVSGSTGCNSFGGRYQVAANMIVFSEIVSTLRACTDEAVMQREQRLLQAFGAPVQFELQGEQLVITSDSGEVLTFVRAADGAGDGTPTVEPSEA